MRFVIVGAGRVGLRTARVLAEEGHEGTVIENDPDQLERLWGERLEIVDILDGDGGNEDDLVDAGIEEADAVGALTGDVTTNIMACLIAKSRGCRTVMRIDNDEYEGIYRKYAAEVDEVIYPERLGAIGAKNALLGGTIRAIADIAHHLQLVEFTITPDSPTRGYTLSELELPGDARLLAFGKEGSALGLPHADDSLEEGDRVVALADFGVLGDVRRIIAGDTSRAAGDA
ncbi:potassium channel family protein [Halococcus saccharolyticus]|uniref:TrkA-N domain-containing protein n=1 Tax=Halococcus saccharolyticus DSM 5350 TaxID=1227455 RepID=M0MQA3_9EURY|nr:TrkA family potassium uptake protein [Halococcus saccharolyticus]EMA46650.1 TrkA-N domain-containing protein [Halococcus saccharolyticus DSM 5350]